MALGTEPYRHLYAADLTALRDLSVMAERVYVHLACGERSSACCMASCDPEHLRYSVRARRTSEVMDALAELEAAGWIVLDLAAKQAWLPVQAKRTWIVSDSSATGWRNDLSRFKLSVATRQAAAFIDSAPVPPPKGHGSTPDLRSRNSSSNRNSIPSVAKATDTLAVASMAPAIAIEPQADEVDPFANQPDPWRDLQKKYEDPAKVERYTPTESRLLPEYQNKVVKAEAIRKGILPPEPQQLAMDLPSGKPVKKGPTPAQLDAIFAKKRLAEVVAHWNEVMAGINAPCDYRAVEKMAGTLMGNFAKYQHRDVFDDARCLFGYAMANEPYHAGKNRRPWTLQQWLSAEHLSLVFAAYRAYKGEGKQLTLDLDRTIRDWRLAVETAELNNKIAEANNAY